ncbi:CPBP family intramembrane metalloprotease [Candidatus Acetothermia bacterium]|nr:CPBP family intramembrane metalloprotease [Candidatus Acetothermia bacterium]
MKNPIFYNERRMRPGWRVFFFILCLSALAYLLFALILGPSYLSATDALPSLGELLPGEGLGLVALMVVTALFVLAVDRRPWPTLGVALTRSGLKELFLGLGLGSLLISAVFVSVLAAGAVRIDGIHFDVEKIFAGQFGLSLAFLIISAISEELQLRGYLFQTFLEGIGVYPTLAVTSVLFALLHVGNPNVNTLALVNIALAGLLLGIAYLRTRALWLPIGIHFTWNLLQAHLFSLPVSGIEIQPKLMDVHTTGSGLLSGGAFGLEGSLITTIVLGGAAIGLWVAPWLRPAEALEFLWRQNLQLAPRGGELP